MKPDAPGKAAPAKILRPDARAESARLGHQRKRGAAKVTLPSISILEREERP